MFSLCKKAMGPHTLFTCCYRAIPTSVSEASVEMEVVVSGVRKLSAVTTLRASLSVRKALSATGVRALLISA